MRQPTIAICGLFPYLRDEYAYRIWGMNMPGFWPIAIYGEIIYTYSQDTPISYAYNAPMFHVWNIYLQNWVILGKGKCW